MTSQQTSDWIDADYYMSGEFGSLADDSGQFLLFMSHDGVSAPSTIVATIDLANRWCCAAGEPLKYDWPNVKVIAVTELPVPEQTDGYSVKTAKDF